MHDQYTLSFQNIYENLLLFMIFYEQLAYNQLSQKQMSSSLKKQLIFGDVTTGFHAKIVIWWRNQW